MGAGVVRVVTSASPVLAAGLAAALGRLDWDVLTDGPDDPAARVLTVLVLADDVGPPAGSSARGSPDVCIGGHGALRGLVRHAERGALVLNGDAPFPVLVRLVDQALRLRTGHPPPHPTSLGLRRRVAESIALDRLTRQEVDVLHALMSGASAAEIALVSHRSLHTVRSHIKAVLAKLGVSSQTAAVALADRAGPPPAVVLDRAQFTNPGDEGRRPAPRR